MDIVKDRKGQPINVGDTVNVFQTEEIRSAKVVEVFPCLPTVKEPGWWIDIDFGKGPEGMMSYVVEVIK